MWIYSYLCEAITEKKNKIRKMISAYSCTYYNELTYWKFVRTNIGWRKNDGTDSSISACVFIKLSVKSGSVRESLTHCPGRGSGTCNV